MKIVDEKCAKKIVAEYPDNIPGHAEGWSPAEVCRAAACTLELHLAVECRDVVLCGECRHLVDHGKHGSRWTICRLLGVNRDPSDFCSSGKKKGVNP